MASRVFPASITKLYEMLDFIRGECLCVGFETQYTYKIELAAEEALVNIINYGYPDKAGSIEIRCHQWPNEGFQIVIVDKGISYNPLTTKFNFDPTSTFHDSPIGGYGIFFIRSLMDEVNYRRENDSNILTLVKRIHKAS